MDPNGGGIDHDLRLDGLRVRNVSTDILGFDNSIEVEGNSIFVFEVADLCIAHLGHLHHKPTDDQFAEIGFIDVVMAPVDGVFTMSVEEMIETLKRLRARVVLPMHAFGPGTMARFLVGMQDEFEIDVRDEHSIVVSNATLPAAPTVIALRPYYPPSND